MLLNGWIATGTLPYKTVRDFPTPSSIIINHHPLLSSHSLITHDVISTTATATLSSSPTTTTTTSKFYPGNTTIGCLIQLAFIHRRLPLFSFDYWQTNIRSRSTTNNNNTIRSIIICFCVKSPSFLFLCSTALNQESPNSMSRHVNIINNNATIQATAAISPIHHMAIEKSVTFLMSRIGTSRNGCTAYVWSWCTRSSTEQATNHYSDTNPRCSSHYGMMSSFVWCSII